MSQIRDMTNPLRGSFFGNTNIVSLCFVKRTSRGEVMEVMTDGHWRFADYSKCAYFVLPLTQLVKAEQSLGCTAVGSEVYAVRLTWCAEYSDSMRMICYAFARRGPSSGDGVRYELKTGRSGLVDVVSFVQSGSRMSMRVGEQNGQDDSDTSVRVIDAVEGRSIPRFLGHGDVIGDSHVMVDGVVRKTRGSVYRELFMLSADPPILRRKVVAFESFIEFNTEEIRSDDVEVFIGTGFVEPGRSRTTGVVLKDVRMEILYC